MDYVALNNGIRMPLAAFGAVACCALLYDDGVREINSMPYRALRQDMSARSAHKDRRS